MKKTIALFILFYCSVTVCRAQDFIVEDSSSFHCLFKISFLGKTVSNGEQIIYSTIHHPNVVKSGGVVPDTVTVDSFRKGDMGRFVGDSMADITTAEVVVESCDGKKKYEIEKTLLEYFIANDYTVTPLQYWSEGAFINLKKSFEVHNEFEKLTIVLKDVAEPIYLSILIGIDPKK